MNRIRMESARPAEQGRRAARRSVWKIGAVAAVGALLVVGSAVPAGAEVAGAYMARLDLKPLGVQRVERLAMILHESGAVTFISEHETDKESAGVGTWKDLGGGMISIGALGFRHGATSLCGVVGVTSPPGNCLLQVGGVLKQNGNKLVGELTLSLRRTKGKGGALVLGDPFPCA